MKRELDLDAMLREPIVRLMMERDGIVSGDVRQILQKVKSARSMKLRADQPLEAVLSQAQAGSDRQPAEASTV